MPVGHRMPRDEFDLLPEKKKRLILRNRKNALKTRKRRQCRIVQRERDNALLHAGIELKEQQIRVFCHLLNKEIPEYLDDTFHTFVFPLIELRSLENVSDKKMRNRICSHNSLAKLKNKVYEVEITNDLLLDRNQKLSLILDGLVRG